MAILHDSRQARVSELTSSFEDFFDATPKAAESASGSILFLFGVETPECALESVSSVA